jgi:predicted enzyme related to lactoylglutathione lyase
VTTTVDTRPAIVGVTLYSARPDVLASFYAKVIGTSLDGGVDHLSGEAMFRTQLEGLEFEIIGSSAVLGAGSIQPSVQVPDVASAVQRALDGDGSVHLGVADHDWGTFAIVVDPDGNRLGLYAPSSPSHSDTEDQA